MLKGIAAPGRLAGVLVCLLLLISPLYMFAQRTAVYEEDIRFYNRALELYNKEKYGVAQKHAVIFYADGGNLRCVQLFWP